MRIGISTSVIQRGRTGIAQYVFALLRTFEAQDSGHDFYLYVLEEDLPLFDFARGAMHLVPVAERFRSAVNNIAWHQAELPRLARRDALDVLHIPSYRRLLATRPCAMVATIHDLAPFQVPGKYDWKRMFYGRVIVKWLARRQDAIIAISENTARDIQHFFRVRSDRIRVIPNGLDHERFYPKDSARAGSEILKRHGLVSPFFLYVARLEHPGKNHVRLIEAFERFKLATGSNWRLVLTGSDWHGAEKIHQSIQNSAVASHIHALGFVPDAELPELYRAADGFVYPSLYEGFGMPPVEAMACGCPVISSTRGALAEVVGSAAALVDPENVESIAAQLRIVATQPMERNRLIAAGLKQAARYAWERTAAATLDIYGRFARKAARRAPVPVRRAHFDTATGVPDSSGRSSENRRAAG